MKKTKKQLLVTFAVAIGILCIPFPASAQTNASAAPSTEYTQISPRKDQLEWRFKVVDGKLYRRLYNTTSQKWVGEWEVVE